MNDDEFDLKDVILRAIRDSQLDCGLIWCKEAQEELADEIAMAVLAHMVTSSQRSLATRAHLLSL